MMVVVPLETAEWISRESKANDISPHEFVSRMVLKGHADHVESARNRVEQEIMKDWMDSPMRHERLRKPMLIRVKDAPDE